MEGVPMLHTTSNPINTPSPASVGATPDSIFLCVDAWQPRFLSRVRLW